MKYENLEQATMVPKLSRMLVDSFTISDSYNIAIDTILKYANERLQDDLWLMTFSDVINPQVRLVSILRGGEETVYQFEIYGDIAPVDVLDENVEMKAAFKDLRETAFLDRLDRNKVMELCCRFIGNS